MQRFVALVGTLVIAGVLIVAAQIPNAFGAVVPPLNLAPGDSLTINCGTSLSGSPSGRQATFSCAPNATSTSTSTPTRTSVPTATRTALPTSTLTATPAPGGCPCSLFPANTVPIAPHGSDVSSVEVGVRFRADSSGFVTGIRFYKLGANTSQHVAHLWNASGALLATANFTSESASGWQQVDLASPVVIAANTIYVASYHTQGRYAGDLNYFANPVNRGPLHAPAASAGGNGVYAYGSSALFPTNTYNALNYWVDVVFRP